MDGDLVKGFPSCVRPGANAQSHICQEPAEVREDSEEAERGAELLTFVVTDLHA